MPFDPDQFIAANTPGSAPPTQGGFDPDTFIQQKTYGTGLQQAAAIGEGVAKGLAGPLATYAETKLGVPAEDIVARQEANPWAHGLAEAGSLAGSLFTGVGEAGLIAKGVGHLVPSGASALGKIGSAAIRGAIENGLIQGGDEISKSILGVGDPQAPVASAMANMGAASLLGAGLGGAFGTAGAALKRLGELKGGTKAQEFLTDFEARTNFRHENPNIAEHVSDELKNFHGSTKEAADEVYGSGGLKDEAIKKLVPEKSAAMVEQQNEIGKTLQTKLEEMKADPESYPSRLTKKFDRLVSDWSEVASAPTSSSHEIFNATQKLKQELQAHSKFDYQVGPLSPEKDFIKITKEVGHDLRNKLEDHKVWEGAGKIQQGVNKAFGEFLPALKDFESKFGTKVLGEVNIDPEKINTYVKQIDKDKGVLNKAKMENFVKAAEKYRSQIDNLHHTLGLESPLESASLHATKGTLGGRTAGARFADYWHDKVPGGTHFIGARGFTVAGGLAGGVPGAIAGFALEKLAPIIEKQIGRPLNRYGTAAALKVLSSGNARRIIQAVDYANEAGRGFQKMNRAVEGVFRGGAAAATEQEASEKDREKLKKFIKEGKMQQQLTQLGNDDAPNAIAEHFPTQNMLLAAAKGRINDYLSSIAPQDAPPALPFDEKLEDPLAEIAYNKALDIAIAPLSILNDVKRGDITPQDMKHFVSMYPEMQDQLAKSITQKIVDKQIDAEQIPYSTKQGLSLFLSAPMDSTFVPQNMQAAQSAFLPQKAASQGQGQAPKKTAKGTSKLGELAKNSRTSDQAVIARQQKV